MPPLPLRLSRLPSTPGATLACGSPARAALLILALSGMLAAAAPANAQTAPAATAPATAAPPTATSLAADDFIKQLSSDVLTAIRQDKSIQEGDTHQIIALVDTKVLPHVNFERMTRSAAGRYWPQATPDQKRRLQDEFKTLLVRTYAGALTQAGDKTLDVKPLRAAPGAKEVIVRSEVRGGAGDPIKLDYRLERGDGGWKIYDVNILGAWLAENYRNVFAQEISASGIDGLIAKLAERNKAIANKAGAARSASKS